VLAVRIATVPVVFFNKPNIMRLWYDILECGRKRLVRRSWLRRKREAAFKAPSHFVCRSTPERRPQGDCCKVKADENGYDIS
jgi:hypothetical protein